MMRRILVGAALAGLAFVGTAAPAMATPGPSAINTGNALLSQITALDTVPVLNGAANGSLNNNDILSVLHLECVKVNVLNNNRPM